MFVLLVVPTGLFAVASGLGWVALPYELYLVSRRVPHAFSAHMAASGLALMSIPIAIFVRKLRGPHRAVGRIAAASVVIGGLTALPVALASEAHPIARAGFFAQAIVWLILVVNAFVAIRSREVARHRQLMLCVAAVASGAIWLRLATATTVSTGSPFAAVYATAAWLSWLVPLAIAATWALRDRVRFASLLR
jgi:hypothetical protein